MTANTLWLQKTGPQRSKGDNMTTTAAIIVGVMVGVLIGLAVFLLRLEAEHFEDHLHHI